MATSLPKVSNSRLFPNRQSLARLARINGVYALLLCLSACQLIPTSIFGEKPENEQEKRASLTDLAKSQYSKNQANKDNDLAKNRLSKAERLAKLADIYQVMLTLEPDANVRAQVNYRLVELDAEYFEEFGLTELDNDTSKILLAKLIADYQTLLQRYPTRIENENIYYQLAKAYDLQGKLLQSLTTTQQLLRLYPDTQHLAELAFRQAEIHYSLQEYDQALAAYQRVLVADNNEKYRLNSLYMSGWSLFKANLLVKADQQFIGVLFELINEQAEIKALQDRIVAKYQPLDESQSGPASDFSKLSQSKQSLAVDTLRILTISLSQQQQVDSLIALLDNFQQGENASDAIVGVEHVLFEELALFLLEKKLEHDAILTYQAYIERDPDSFWSARFSTALIALAKKQGDHPKVRQLQQSYVEQFGLNNKFWQQASASEQQEVLPLLLQFSEQHSRRLYAQAQDIKKPDDRVQAFSGAANWLNTYLTIAKLAQENFQDDFTALAIDLLADEFLFADASFEAQHYQQALKSYQLIAYNQDFISTKAAGTDDKHAEIKKSAAYATTLTIRKLLAVDNTLPKAELITQRAQIDHAFVVNYPQDKRALDIASQAAQYSFKQARLEQTRIMKAGTKSVADKQMVAMSALFEQVSFYSDFILTAHNIPLCDIDTTTALNSNRMSACIRKAKSVKPKLSTNALKQVQIASQLKADSFYQQKLYPDAEQSYLLALQFLNKRDAKTKITEINELIASSIYQQGQLVKDSQPELAVAHWLRLSKVTPQASYRVNAEFDAANLLLEHQKWTQAVKVLLAFQQHFPRHDYSASIPAKLANSYQQLEQYEQAAEQLIVMQKNTDSKELKRELQYSIAENYLKAKDIAKAIIHFRSYAHSYPEPFAVAQEVRFKLSEFYRETKEPNKRYFWYRKLLASHKTAVQSNKAPKLDVTTQQRSTYFASMAAYELGRAHQQSFTATKLTLPLNKSLKRKQGFLKQAVDYYQQVFTFALADFVPKANYQLASMYQLLAADMLTSQRPKDLDELALEEYEILLEELAYPFEEKAIELHSSNAERSWLGIYDEWVQKSFTALAKLEPAKFDKSEKQPEAIYALY
ncbi:MAG: tetratricopeptide repeat protein [Cognaticolwellia sp.]